MSFLAPLFLFGALAIGLPILFHLIRRTTREVTPFSSLMFLLPTPPRVTRRSRLENLWLLLLRCLVLLVLAFGFARPFVQRAMDSAAPAAGEGKRTVILVDTSASLRREDLWTQARLKAETWLRKAGPLDEVSLAGFDRSTRTLLSGEQWRQMEPDARVAAALQRLDILQPGWAKTALGPALLQAAETLAKPAAGERPGEIVVISDLQEGSQLDGLQGYEWPAGLTVVLDPLEPKKNANASAQWISEFEDPNPAAEQSGLRLRVRNAADAPREQFQLRWNGAPDSAALDAYVPAGQSRTVRTPKPPAGTDRLLLTGDEVDFDNTLFVLPPEPQRVPILFAGSDAGDRTSDSHFYLARAFQTSGWHRVEILTQRGDAPIAAPLLRQARLLITGAGVGEGALGSLREFARGGKIVLFPLLDAAGGESLARLLEIPALAVSEASVKNYALLGQIDFQHPLFSPFADPRYSDFTKIHFWKHRRLDEARLPGARVLARFDDRDPALVQVPLGSGSVVVLTSTWRPIDSQLALSSKFVPLLYALLDQSGGRLEQKPQYFVGDALPIRAGAEAVLVRKPDGTEARAEPGAAFAATDEPGIYRLANGTQRFVVNLSPDESLIAALPADRLASLGVPLSKSARAGEARPADKQGHLPAAELESRQKLWRWLIVAALVFLLCETLLAARLARSPNLEAEASS
ncbi:MAG: BatA domain-containing protein [Verrucomicrobiota bacterium]|nr:BatA domain-containing protein [Verrucomicrobiota bacterium]